MVKQPTQTQQQNIQKYKNHPLFIKKYIQTTTSKHITFKTHAQTRGVSTPFWESTVFCLIFLKIVLNSISDRFYLTLQGKMRFGHCQGHAKDHTDSLR